MFLSREKPDRSRRDFLCRLGRHTELSVKIHQEKKMERFYMHKVFVRVKTGMDGVMTKTNQRAEHRLSMPCERCV